MVAAADCLHSVGGRQGAPIWGAVRRYTRGLGVAAMLNPSASAVASRKALGYRKQKVSVDQIDCLPAPTQH